MVVKALLMLTILNGHIFLVTLPLSKHRDAGDLRRHRTHFDVNVMWNIYDIFLFLELFLFLEIFILMGCATFLGRGCSLIVVLNRQHFDFGGTLICQVVRFSCTYINHSLDQRYVVWPITHTYQCSFIVFHCGYTLSSYWIHMTNYPNTSELLHWLWLSKCNHLKSHLLRSGLPHGYANFQATSTMSPRASFVASDSNE